MSSSYSTMAIALPSGPRPGTAPVSRASVRQLVRRCASTTGSGSNSGVSSVAYPTTTHWSPAPMASGSPLVSSGSLIAASMSGLWGMDQALDLKSLGSYPAFSSASRGQFAHVRQRGGADLARQEDVAFGCQHFAGHTGVAGQEPDSRPAQCLRSGRRVYRGGRLLRIQRNKNASYVSPYKIMLGRSRCGCAPGGLDVIEWVCSGGPVVRRRHRRAPPA